MKSDEPVVVETVTLVVTQPSIAPQYRTDRAWELRRSQVADFDQTIARFLDETEVNGVASLREVVVMTRDKDVAGLMRVHAARPLSKVRPSGGSVANLRIVGTDFVYSFDEGYEYSNDAYTALRVYVVANAEMRESAPAELDALGPSSPSGTTPTSPRATQQEAPAQ